MQVTEQLNLDESHIGLDTFSLISATNLVDSNLQLPLAGNLILVLHRFHHKELLNNNGEMLTVRTWAGLPPQRHHQHSCVALADGLS
jgi:hypothetical protein